MKTPRYTYLLLLFSLALIIIAVLNYTTPQEEKISAKRETTKGKEKNYFGEPWLSILHYDAIPARHKNKIARTTILNTLIEKFDYQSYLEIGQSYSQNNFDWINCPTKVGVDPDLRVNATYPITSDKFFALNKILRNSFDLIFVDGLHHASQVEKDILNSLDVLNENGTIVVHDCNPTTEAMQIIPRQKNPVWTGDVWKAWVKLRATKPDLKMYVIDTETGCGIIRKGKQETITIPGALTYKMLDENRKEFLNLQDINYFLNGFKKVREQTAYCPHPSI